VLFNCVVCTGSTVPDRIHDITEGGIAEGEVTEEEAATTTDIKQICETQVG